MTNLRMAFQIKRLLDVLSGFEGVPGSRILSPSVLVNGDGGTDDACG